MKPKILKLLSVFLLFLQLALVLLGVGCDTNETDPDEKEEICDYMLTETDPAELIIGRWELLKDYDRTVQPEEVFYWEFEPDSSATWQTFPDGELHTINFKFWVEVDDSLIHYSRGTGFPHTPWRFQFPDNCTLNAWNGWPSLTPLNYTFKRTNE